jgi:hypothetical protein
MEAGMQVEEIPLRDPGQDGPAWIWSGPGFPAAEAEQIHRKFAARMLRLQKQFCVSGDPVHALIAMTTCQTHHVVLPPWVERTVAQLAWVTIMAPTTVRGRRLRRTHWIRFVAVNEHLRQQRAAGVERPNKRRAFREVSVALRGQLGRGTWARIQFSYNKVCKAVKRGEADQFALGVLDNRYSIGSLGNPRARPPWM